MKQHTSVLYLMLRASMVPALIICASMVLAEVLIFSVLLSASFDLVSILDCNSGLFNYSVLALTIFLLRMGCKRGSNPGLTLQRLSISEQRVFLIQSGCNLFFYLLLSLVQALLLVFFAMYVLPNAPRQALLLIFHDSTFAHTVFPFRDVLLWISNGVMLLTLSMATAHVPYAQRRGKHLHEIILVMIVFVLTIRHDTHAMLQNTLTILVCILFLSYTLHCVFREEDVYDEAELL